MKKIAKNGWDLLERARAQEGKVSSMRMFATDGTVLEFGPENFKKDGTMKIGLIRKIADLRNMGILASV